jgi:hypothetical protein
MQRWIAVGVVAMMVLLGGAWFAHRVYKQNRPQPIWVPMQINPELPAAKRDAIIKELKAKLSEQQVLLKVSQDLGLTKKWQLATDAACANKIREELFVRSGEADTPKGKVPSINIGVTGKNKESAISSEIALRLMDDVWKILGVTPPKSPKSPPQ